MEWEAKAAQGGTTATGASAGRSRVTTLISEFLVKEGIDSVSLTPDSVMKITVKVTEMERGF